MQRDKLSPRLCTVLDLLPKHGWQVKPAAIEAGYSESYADRLSAILKHNVRFCQAVEARQAEIGATEADKVAKLAQSWEKIAHDDSVTMRDRLKAGELLGKTYGIFAERRILEKPERQQEMDRTKRALAAEFAVWWGQRQAMCLPGDMPALPGKTDEQDPAA
jgi:ribosomal protein L9